MPASKNFASKWVVSISASRQRTLRVSHAGKKTMSKKSSKAKPKRLPALRSSRLVRARKPNLADLVKAAQKAGAKVSVSLEPKQMPMRFPSDPAEVRLLLEESERVSKLGNHWLNADVPNHVAAETCFRNGWAYALAGAWLRCKLKGELNPEKNAP